MATTVSSSKPTPKDDKKDDNINDKKDNKKDDKPTLGVFKQVLPKEDPNDPFDRQRCIPGWEQSIIEKQTALVLGVGGIGCTVAMALARLGIGRIILIDYDKVECSNLNRQILFTLRDVGKLKVDAAQENLKKYHIISSKTQIEAYNTDVLKKWSFIVELAKKSTILFNNIDYGGGFDIAAISLAMKLKIPYASGSSYCHTWIVEYFTGNPKHSSFSYDNPEISADIVDKLTPNKIMNYNDLLFIPKDNNPPTRLIGSSPLCAVMGGMMTVNAWIQGIIQDDHIMPNFSKMDICHYTDPDDLVAWPMPTKEDNIPIQQQNDQNTQAKPAQDVQPVNPAQPVQIQPDQKPKDDNVSDPDVSNK